MRERQTFRHYSLHHLGLSWGLSWGAQCSRSDLQSYSGLPRSEYLIQSNHTTIRSTQIIPANRVSGLIRLGGGGDGGA